MPGRRWAAPCRASTLLNKLANGDTPLFRGSASNLLAGASVTVAGKGVQGNCTLTLKVS